MQPEVLSRAQTLSNNFQKPIQDVAAEGIASKQRQPSRGQPPPTAQKASSKSAPEQPHKSHCFHFRACCRHVAHISWQATA